LAIRLAEAEAVGWDVLVVDNASKDKTEEVVCALIPEFPVALRVIEERHQGVAFARNTGLREASGDVVVFADDDVTFGEGWVAAWEEVFTDPSVAAGGGPILPVFPPSSAAWLMKSLMAERGGPTGFYHCGDEKRVREKTDQFNFPQTANAAVRRSVALAAGGFREDLGWGKEKRIPGEDTELFRKLYHTGAKVLYSPAPKVDHYLTEEMVEVEYFRQWHRGYGRASVLMKSPFSTLAWASKFCEQVATLIIYSVRLHLPGGSRCLRAHRKQSQARGRLAQLAGR
jgi:GT2 family glycosyltransferase